MKKICYITTISMTMKAFIMDMAQYLHENTDWDITFVCDEDPKFRKMLPAYFHYHSIPMKRGISMGGIRAMLEMKKFFQKEKFDLVQYATPNASLYAALASRMARIPVRLYCQWGMAYVGFKGIKRAIFKCVEKLVCALSTEIEPDSKSNLEFSHREGLYADTKGHVIWNGSACGVNLKKFDITKKQGFRKEIRARFNIPENAFVFGYVGRITRDKGINELFTSMRSLMESFDDCYLLLVGSAERDATIHEDLKKWSEANKKVISIGFTDIVEQYLSAMDVFVLPSYREGFGMGVVEAEAMGIPVIVTKIPGPADAMLDGETGLTVSVKSSNDLQKAMIRMKTEIQCGRNYEKTTSDFAVNHFRQDVFMRKMLQDRRALIKE